MAAGERPPIPERLQELVEDRLEGLPAETLEALEVVSALSTPTLDAIAAAIAILPTVDRRLGPALENGVVEVVGDRVRFTHPLLASAVYQKIPLARRRELHARLATIVRDPEERARHLALSVEGPDVAVAAALEEAAPLAVLPGSAAIRGRALGDGPPRHAAGSRRGPGASDPPGGRGALTSAGTPSLARSVLEQAVDLSMAGPARGRVLLDLGMGLAETEGWRGAWAVFEAARGEAGDDRALQGTDRAEPRVHLAVQGRPRGIGTARSRSAAAGRGAAGPTGDGRSVPGVSVRRVPPRTRGRSGAARSRGRPRRAHGGRIQVPRPACELRRGAAPQVHRSPGRGPPDVHRAPGRCRGARCREPDPAVPLPPRRAGMLGGQLGCGHGARPGEQGGRPATPHGGAIGVGGPLRGRPGASPSGAGRPGEAGSPRRTAGRRGGRARSSS